MWTFGSLLKKLSLPVVSAPTPTTPAQKHSAAQGTLFAVPQKKHPPGWSVDAKTGKPHRAGWQRAPGSKVGGMRRRSRGGWEYWYPHRKKKHIKGDGHYGKDQPTLADAVKRQKEDNVPLVVNYGLGVDSTAILVELHRRGIRPDAIFFADVRAENPASYAYLPVMQEWLRGVGFPPVTTVNKDFKTMKPGKLTQATGKDIGGQKIYSLEEECIANETLPSLAFGANRRCSQTWKHAPIEKQANTWPPAVDAFNRGFKVSKLIGYDETELHRKEIPEDDKYAYVYPLREWKMDREKAKAAIARAGLPVPVKSACFFCPATKAHEIRAITKKHPDLARRIIQMEAGAEGGLRDIHGLWGTPVKGFKSPKTGLFAIKKPGSMTEFIVGEELLPEFKNIGRKIAPPWWRKKGPQKVLPKPLLPSSVWHLVQPISDTAPKDLYVDMSATAACVGGACGTVKEAQQALAFKALTAFVPWRRYVLG